MYKYSLRLITTCLTSKSYSTSLDGLCVNSSTLSWTLLILASSLCTFHRRCENQFLDNHLYQCRVLWRLYFCQVKYNLLIINLFQLGFFIHPIFPLNGAVRSTRTLILFLLDFLGASQNWGRRVLRPLPPFPPPASFLKSLFYSHETWHTH